MDGCWIIFMCSVEQACPGLASGMLGLCRLMGLLFSFSKFFPIVGVVFVFVEDLFHL
jgi:hypothetical protein